MTIWRSGAAVAAVVLAAAAAWYWRAAPRLAGVAIAADYTKIVADNAARNAPTHVPSPSPSPAAGDGVPPRVRPAMAAGLRRRKEISRAGRDSTDALAFVRSLLQAARNDDTEAQYAIAMELQGCYWWDHWQIKGKTYRERLQDPTWNPNGRDRIQGFLTRCEGLNSAPQDEVGSYAGWMRQAAADGDGRALLEQAGDSEGRSLENQVADFHRAIDTGDPDVLRRIVSSYAYASDGYSWRSNQPADLQQQEQLLDAALNLADCQLGAGCALQDLQQDCADPHSAIDCSYATDLNNYYEIHLSREDFSQVTQRAQTFVDDFLGGGYDWPEARAYEDQLRSPPRGRP